ncbi:four-carbon acid sugar kinase family protein [Flavivirga abyssicola]|uniref:four-carbon acid sugar kinase family protein n=1 Tax=Flavivirga abyssicola TaxID=3063533 RepID=UPI0026DFEECB|nr:four-carbon acid sugar kinase family protein [Flavivirga sp. MEBiC07777]WVK12002.1 four-carbon acid sugar kinase family protein [Flavivirga sp. MEBiC07777]
MSFSLSHISKQLPLEDTSNYRRLNKVLFKELNRTCIVIDDDPTGNQTVYDIPLLTPWDLETLIDEFKKETPVFFLLTNSRSLSQKKSSEVYQEISKNILEASKLINRPFTVISRSDSTLRGHFSEIDVIKNTLNFNDAITVFLPVMFEGNRVTVNDIHYISDGDHLIPVNDTPFSQDHTFAYSKANLKEWIEEKTSGKVNASDVFSLPIETVRSKNTEWLSEQIKALKPGTFCISNALNYYDLDKITQALLLAEKWGKRIVYRTSSSFVPSYIGLEPKPLLTSEKIINSDSQTGGLTIVGSYVPKSSEQLNYTLNYYNKNNIIEINVETILKEDADLYLASIITKIDESIARGNDVIVYTSRKLITGKNADSNIDIASKVSDALVTLVKGIGVCPKYILAKGGITSHDLALKGLGMRRSKVLGQIEPGVPVWQMGKETKFPKLLYIVFPGNVGHKKSLLTITQKLS